MCGHRDPGETIPLKGQADLPDTGLEPLARKLVIS